MIPGILTGEEGLRTVLTKYIMWTGDRWHHRVHFLVGSCYGGILRVSSPTRNIPVLPTQYQSSETDLGDLFQQLCRRPCSQQRCDSHRVKRVCLTSSSVSGHTTSNHTTYEFANTYWRKTLQSSMLKITHTKNIGLTQATQGYECYTHSCLTLWPHRRKLCQSPLSMEFSRKEYWSKLLFPTPGYLSDPGIKPVSLVSPPLLGGLFTSELPGKGYLKMVLHKQSLSRP